MTAEQKLFLEAVVLPKLVEMAINDTLPLDMTQLSSYDFEEETIAFNESQGIIPEERKICYWTLADVEHVVDEYNEDDDNEPIEYTDELGHEVLDIVEDRFDANYGVSWDDLRNALEEVID